MPAPTTAVTLDGTSPEYQPHVGDGLTAVDRYKRSVQVQICEEDNDRIVFDLVGIEAPVANAIRRILLSEVPTMAIEHVYIRNNTSIIQDEVLAHRLGLIPLAADPRLFDFKHDDAATDANTLVFKLDVVGINEPKTDAGLEKFTHVYSGQLEWVPQGNQAEQFAACPVRPVSDDILIAKLKPGQRITVEAHAIKGIGHDHAKWSPVATASYRLIPVVKIIDEIVGEDAEDLAALSPVFDVEQTAEGHKKAIVASARDCNMSRELLRDPRWANRIHIARQNDHFIFSVETTGALPPRELVREALRIFRSKCEESLGALDRWRNGSAGAAE